MRIAIHIPLLRLTLRELVRLRPGDVLRSEWPVADDLPVRAGDALLSWAEFENVDGRMAVRLTQLS